MTTATDDVRDQLARVLADENGLPPTSEAMDVLVTVVQALQDRDLIWAMHSMPATPRASTYAGDVVGELISDYIQDDDHRPCERCGDQVLTLSSRDWCDGCEEADVIPGEVWSQFLSQEMQLDHEHRGDVTLSGVIAELERIRAER